MSNVEKANLVEPWEKLGINSTGIGQIPQMLDIMFASKQKRTLCMVGETGIGKTPIVKQWVAERGGYCRMFSFAHMSREDMSMVMFNDDGSTYDFLPAQWLLELNRQAEETGLAVLFMDEWNRGEKDLVNSLFTLTDERRMHNIELHENVLLIAAMNPSGGSYMVNEAERDHAVRKRLCFVYVEPDIADWIDYTKKTAWHPLVPAFVKASPKDFYDRGARDAGKAFPCPANWEKVSDYLLAAQSSGVGLDSPALDTLITGQIGTITARKFVEYVKNQNTLIEPSEVLHGYGPKTAVRKRVLTLLNKKTDPATDRIAVDDQGVALVAKKNRVVRNDIMAELLEGVGLELFATKPNPAKIAESLAWFLHDLDNELLGAFASQHLHGNAERQGAEGKRYFSSVSSAMQKFSVYKNKMREIVHAQKRYKASAGLLKGQDPAK